MCLCWAVCRVTSIKLHVGQTFNVKQEKSLIKLSDISSLLSPLSLSLSTHLTVTHLHGQPAVVGKLELLAGLQVADDDGPKEPGGEYSDPGVVVPDPEILQASQALPSSHDETVNSSSVKCDAGKCSDVGLLLLSTQDELNLGLAARLVLGAS